MVTRILGSGLALLAFAIATLAGLAVHNPLDVVLSRALLALVVFFAVGAGLGWVIQRIIVEYLSDRQRRRQPVTHEEAVESSAPPVLAAPKKEVVLKPST